MNDSQQTRLLALIWGHQLYHPDSLTTPAGQTVGVDHPGLPALDDGSLDPRPDFSDACVRYAGDAGGPPVSLHGSVRIDALASAWRGTGQLSHPAFDSVAFHVVCERDKVIMRRGREVPTLLLRPDSALEQLSEQLHASALSGMGGCVTWFSDLEPIHQGQILARLVADRLRRKTYEIDQIHQSVGRDWDQTAYITLMRSLGIGNQKYSYEALARSVPLSCYVRCAGDSRQAEALLLGQSGYLNFVSAPDLGIRQMQQTYLQLKQEYGLKRPVVSWTGGAIRPVSLPPSMLRRTAELLVRSPCLADRIRESRTLGELRELFAGIDTPARTDLRLINFVIPLLTAIGRESRDPSLQELALALYDGLPAEQNRYIRLWSAHGFTPRSAFDSQALIQLATEYCGRQRCTECPVGARQLVRQWRELQKKDPLFGE